MLSYNTFSNKLKEVKGNCHPTVWHTQIREVINFRGYKNDGKFAVVFLDTM